MPRLIIIAAVLAVPADPNTVRTTSVAGVPSSDWSAARVGDSVFGGGGWGGRRR